MDNTYKRQIGDLLYQRDAKFGDVTHYHIIIGFDRTDWDDIDIPLYVTYNLTTNKYCTYGRIVVENYMRKLA